MPSAAEPVGDAHLWITVLAGGMGSRFWPVSTPSRPKQLLALAGDDPLILETVSRARALVPDRRIRVLAGEHLVQPVRAVVPDLPSASFLVEPRARGTAPVLTWAAWTVHREDPEAVMISLHADHLIRLLEPFRRSLLAAAEVAGRDRLLLSLGARPDRPETGYGYIQPGEPLVPPEGAPELEPRRVRAFHEKPDRDTAARYVEEGYLWNTGIFVWKAAGFLEEVRRHTPEVSDALPLLDAGDTEGFFDAVTPVSVDVGVMERSRRVGVLPAPFEWDDVGAWHSLHRTRSGDQAGNVVEGEGLVVEGRDNVVWDEEGTVVLFGVDDLVVVRAGEVTLVTSRHRAPDLKTLLDHVPDALREDR